MLSLGRIRSGLLQCWVGHFDPSSHINDLMNVRPMLGSFVGLYKAILNALPIVLPVTPSGPPPSPFEDDKEDESAAATPLEIPLSERQPRLSLSARAHQQWVHKKTRRWHAVVAGAIAGGVAIMFEKRSRRLIIGQQLFVRCVSSRVCTVIGLSNGLQRPSRVI